MRAGAIRAVVDGRSQPAGDGLGRRLELASTAMVVGVGGLLLAARAWITPVAGATRVVTALVLFGGILVASLLVPVPASPSGSRSTVAQREATSRVPVATAFLLGVVALAGAAVVAGTPVPFARVAWVLPLSIVAAVAEEALFRRVAYGGLARFGAVVAVVGSAVLFAVVHGPLYGVAALPVDLGAGLVFGWQRWATGSWTTPAATHAAANVVAVLR
jgi:membrane protease YdiL (CAAX protease family)